MTGYMIEFLSSASVWVKAGSVFLDRAEAEDALHIVQLCDGEYRLVPVPIRGDVSAYSEIVDNVAVG